jgi:BirA family biotin operon repressor/biotin-[acetyl-CoA-carboxylase] ligase
LAAAAVPDTFISRLERFGSIASTQPVVREWLEQGTPEVAVATADEQTAGRGRQGRGWAAPPGTALLVSAGFRPSHLELKHAWRLAATAALAMIDAAEDVAGLKEGVIWLKWPNDLVADADDGRLVKLAGVLGESAPTPDGGHVATAVIGIGINADWAAAAFPPELRDSMTSLRELSGGRPIDRDALLDAWLDRLEPRYEALQTGHFDAGAWSTRQRTTGHSVEVDLGGARLTGTAQGVDPESGALLVRGHDGTTQPIGSGEVIRCRIVETPTFRRSASG